MRRTRMYYRLWPALLVAASGVAGAVTVLGVAPDSAGPAGCGSGEQWVQVGPGVDSPFDGPAAMVAAPDTDRRTDGSAQLVATHLDPATGDPSLSACVDLDELPSYPLPPSDPRS